MENTFKRVKPFLSGFKEDDIIEVLSDLLEEAREDGRDLSDSELVELATDILTWDFPGEED